MWAQTIDNRESKAEQENVNQDIREFIIFSFREQENEKNQVKHPSLDG